MYSKLIHCPEPLLSNLIVNPGSDKINPSTADQPGGKSKRSLISSMSDSLFHQLVEKIHILIITKLSFSSEQNEYF